jgi:hypothetical protein
MCLFCCGVALPEAKMMTESLFSTTERSLLKMNFPKTLDTVGKRLIGW